MISLLRKYRKKLIVENKLSRYLIYALGEILLVVIGILIAISINSKKEYELLLKKEQIYLKGLKNQFESSKEKLIQLNQVNRYNYLASEKILEYTSGKFEKPTEKQFSELLFRSFSFSVSFNANNSLLNEMINSGSLKDISNNQLRILLTNWKSTLDNVSSQEEKLGNQRQKVLDMFISNKYSIRTIFEQTNPNSSISKENRENSVSNLSILNALEFENNILMFYLTSQAIEMSYYKPLLKEMNSILDLIELDIN